MSQFRIICWDRHVHIHMYVYMNVCVYMITCSLDERGYRVKADCLALVQIPKCCYFIFQEPDKSVCGEWANPWLFHSLLAQQANWLVTPFRPKTGRGEGSMGPIFFPTGVPNFPQNGPRRVGKYDNFHKYYTKRVIEYGNNTKQEYVWYLKYLAGGWVWGEKGGVKDPYPLWQRECPPRPPSFI